MVIFMECVHYKVISMGMQVYCTRFRESSQTKVTEKISGQVYCTIGSRTVGQKKKKEITFVVLKRRSIHKSCPQTHNHVLYLWRIVTVQG